MKENQLLAVSVPQVSVILRDELGPTGKDCFFQVCWFERREVIYFSRAPSRQEA